MLALPHEWARSLVASQIGFLVIMIGYICTCSDEESYTQLLHFAIAGGHFDIVDMILEWQRRDREENLDGICPHCLERVLAWLEAAGCQLDRNAYRTNTNNVIVARRRLAGDQFALLIDDFEICFRFTRPQFGQLCHQLLLDVGFTHFICYQGTKASVEEAMMLLLLELSRPRTLSEVSMHSSRGGYLFRRSAQEVSMICEAVLVTLYREWRRLVFFWPGMLDRNLMNRWRAGMRLFLYENRIHGLMGGSEAAFSLIGFVDGTYINTTQSSDPGIAAATYSGYKRSCGGNIVVCMSVSGLATAAGRLLPGTRNDLTALSESTLGRALSDPALVQQMRAIPNQPAYLFFADGIFQRTTEMAVPRLQPMNDVERMVNRALGSCRVEVERSFGLLRALFARLGYASGLRWSGLLEATVIVSILFYNCRICLVGHSPTSLRFHTDVPSLEEYLNQDTPAAVGRLIDEQFE
jgi:hypothetical protein